LSGLDGDVVSGERGNPDGSIKSTIGADNTVLVEKADAYSKLLGAFDSAGSGRPSAAVLNTAQRDLQLALRGLSEASERELGHLLAARVSSLNNKMFWSLAVTFVVLLASSALAWIIAGSFRLPLRDLHHAMCAIASGDVMATVSHTDESRIDELGDMARALEGFRQSLVRMRSMEEERKQYEERARVEHAAVVQKMADAFESTSGVMVQNVHGAAMDLQKTAENMGHLMEETTEHTLTVDAASARATANVSMVAAATEQLAASINEIGQLVYRSSTAA
jgi:methyl-accepting chemotaxis protein